MSVPCGENHLCGGWVAREMGKRGGRGQIFANVPAVLAVAADAVLVAHDLPELGAHLVAALAGLKVHNLAGRNSHDEVEKVFLERPGASGESGGA